MSRRARAAATAAPAGAGSEDPPPGRPDLLQPDRDPRHVAVLAEPALEVRLGGDPVVRGPALGHVLGLPAAALPDAVALEADVEVHAVQVDQPEVRVGL